MTMTGKADFQIALEPERYELAAPPAYRNPLLLSHPSLPPPLRVLRVLLCQLAELFVAGQELVFWSHPVDPPERLYGPNLPQGPARINPKFLSERLFIVKVVHKD